MSKKFVVEDLFYPIGRYRALVMEAMNPTKTFLQLTEYDTYVMLQAFQLYEPHCPIDIVRIDDDGKVTVYEDLQKYL